MLMGRYVAQKKPNHHYIEAISKDLMELQSQGRSWADAGMKRRNQAIWVLKTSGFPHRPRNFTGLHRQAWEIDYMGFHLIFFSTKHYPNSSVTWEDSAYSTGVIIDKRFLFSADTRFDEDMIIDISNLFDIEMIFHDVQFFPGGIHAPFEELKAFPKDIRKKTLLMHYPDNYEQYQEQVLEARFQGFCEIPALLRFLKVLYTIVL